MNYKDFPSAYEPCFSNDLQKCFLLFLHGFLKITQKTRKTKENILASTINVRDYFTTRFFPPRMTMPQ